ncbi:MAG: hypothetical protein AB7S71_12595 [Dongiaceae bacterium]
MWRCASLSILVAVVATGCQDEPRTHSVVVVASPAEPAAASPTPPAPPPAPPDVVPLPEHKPEAAAGAVPAAAGPDPKELVGLDFGETEALLGLPTKQEEKPPAKVWTYSGTDCELTIFFYADINTQEFRALTYEVTGNEATGGSDDQCLAQLKQGT